ncbi:TPA: hypothetical protein I8552_004561 [Serratia marcescens]|nr:hypothetical protein [Serratia marcescens]
MFYWKRLLMAIVLIGYSFSGSAGDYVAHGYFSYKYHGPGEREIKGEFSIDDVDWDDSRPIPCPGTGFPDFCLISIITEVNRTPGSSEQHFTSISSKELAEANVKTVGQYFRYLQKKNINFLKTYQVYSIRQTNVDIVYDTDVCLYLGHAWSFGTPLKCRFRFPVIVPSCEIVESQIAINHGSLSADRVNGHIATGDLTISCSDKTSMKLMSPNPNPRLPLAADGSLYSTIYAGDKLLSEGLTVDAGPGNTRVKLTSELGTVGTPKVGQFSGSVVVVLAQP